MMPLILALKEGAWGEAGMVRLIDLSEFEGQASLLSK